MKNSYKLLLKIWLILYFVFTVFRIIHLFNDSIMSNIFGIGVYPLEITAVILFVFVGNRGEEGICKFGIMSVVIFFITYILNKLSVFHLTAYSTVSIMDKLLSITYYTSNNCISICECLAILSLVPSNGKLDKYKTVAILGILGFSLINLVANIFPSIRGEMFDNIRYSMDYIGNLAKYAAIIFCLTDNNYVSSLFATDNNIDIYSINQPVQAVGSSKVVDMNNPIQRNVPTKTVNMDQPVKETVPTPSVVSEQNGQSVVAPQPGSVDQLMQSFVPSEPVSQNVVVQPVPLQQDTTNNVDNNK